jgi:uncharacterized protein YmfQ (DUF2313 family)
VTADDFLHQLLALLPPGKAWSREGVSILTSVMDGIAPEFARVQDRADALQLELDPNTVTEMIDEWESANGLPDDCQDPLSTIEQRRAALISRLREAQGHNPADYVAMGVALGHASTGVLRRPYTPFTVGSPAGAPLYGPDWLFAFDVHYMANLIASPHDFTTWTNVNVTVSANATYDPAGSAIADSLDFGAVAPASRTLAIAGAPLHVQFSVWLVSYTGLHQVQLDIIAVDGTVSSKIVTVDERWGRHEHRAEDSSGIASVRISRVGTGSGYLVYAWGACAGEVDDVFECRLDTVKQAHTVALYRVVGDRAGYIAGDFVSLGALTASAAGTVV